MQHFFITVHIYCSCRLIFRILFWNRVFRRSCYVCLPPLIPAKIVDDYYLSILVMTNTVLCTSKKTWSISRFNICVIYTTTG